MDKKEDLQIKLLRLEACRGYFSKYKQDLLEADKALQSKNIEKCRQILDKLPNEIDLLNSLVLKLKGKKVYITLKKINEGTADIYLSLKGLSSLMTHTIIECEQGSTEYELILPYILKQISILVTQLNKRNS